MSLLFQILKATLSFKGVFPKGRFLNLSYKQLSKYILTNPTILLSFNKTDSSIQLKTIKIAQ